MKDRQNGKKDKPKTGRAMLAAGIIIAVGSVLTLQFGVLLIAVPLIYFGWRRNKEYKAAQSSGVAPVLPENSYSAPGVVRPSTEKPEARIAPSSMSIEFSVPGAAADAPPESEGRTSSTATYTIIKPKSKKALTDIPKHDYTVFDVETTGLSPYDDKIIEIAMIRHRPDGSEQKYHSMFNPRCDIPARITKLTGISNDDLLGAPFIEDCVEDILLFIDGSPLAAHNANFDMKFLCAALDGSKMQADFTVYDTLEMARRTFPDLPNHKLETLISELNLADHDQQHRAADDAECTKKLFEICLSELLTRKEQELAARRAART